MIIKIGELELSSEYKGCDLGDCYITVKVKDDVKPDIEIKNILASELIAAINALNKTCWRP